MLMGGDTEYDTINSTNTLGEISFNTFYTEDGFKILINIIENHSDKLDEISIFDEKMRDYTIEEFLDKIKGLKVK
jgi:uncharacterized protein YozE (UPF0346 family)